MDSSLGLNRTRIAMVCMGNICRSPMAEAVARAMLDEAGLADMVSVDSFGTTGYHVGERPDPSALAALRRRGWPVGDHRAQMIRATDVESFQLVLCADRVNLASVVDLDRTGEAEERIRLLRSFDPFARPGDDEVPDPYGRRDQAFDVALELIEKACRGLVDYLALGTR